MAEGGQVDMEGMRPGRRVRAIGKGQGRAKGGK